MFIYICIYIYVVCNPIHVYVCLYVYNPSRQFTASYFPAIQTCIHIQFHTCCMLSAAP